MKIRKPKFWDIKKPNLLSRLLLIFTIPIMINNFFLNLKSKEKSKKIKTICIGNIYLGGTGKTPTTIKLYQVLSKLKLKISTAKKFYQSQLDEEIILKEKTNFLTAKNRAEIINKAIQNDIDLVIFDDGLQDKSINYDIQFVCFDSKNWLGNGLLLPSGPLREKLKSIKKYDGIFLKNDGSTTADIIQSIKKHNSNIPIFDTKYKILNLKDFKMQEKYLIFSGIGNPYDFKNILLKNNFNIVKEKIFPDHYYYTKKDILYLKELAKKLNLTILTTKKDYVKLPEEFKKEVYFIEIELEINNEERLTNLIKSKLYA